MLDLAKILKFLQIRKFDLSREIPGFLDISIPEDGSPKLVLYVSSPLESSPSIEFEGDQIPVEVKVNFPNGKPIDKTIVMSGPMNPTQILTPEENTNSIPEKVAMNPHERGGRNQQAYEAWQKRHSSRKFGG